MANEVKIQNIHLKRGSKAALEKILVGAKKPLEGEPIFELDTNKLKIGDGISNYKDLPYLTGGGSVPSDVFISGYFFAGDFYKDIDHTVVLPHNLENLYIDITDPNKKEIYLYQSFTGYQKLYNLASETQYGLVKLYNTYGQNKDGTMTQQAITNAINSIKFKVTDDTEISDLSDYCLELAKPW